MAAGASGLAGVASSASGIGAIVNLGLTVAAILEKAFAGCGPTCTQATAFANQAGQAFDQIKSQYFALPFPRTKSQQAAALTSINQIAAALAKGCGQPGLGAAGQRCISERLTPGGSPPGCSSNYVAPGANGDPGIPAGQPCNIYTFYLNPINADKVVEDSIFPGVSGTGIAGVLSSPVATLGSFQISGAEVAIAALLIFVVIYTF